MSRSGFIVLLAALAAPLAFGPFFYDSYVLPKLALASVLGAFAAWVAWREGRLGRTPLDGPLAALFAAALLSAAASPDPRPDWFGAHQSYAWCLLGWAPCLVAFRVAAGQDAEFGRRLVASLAAAAVVVGAYAVAQAAGLDPLAARLALPAGGRAVSTLGSPVALGCFAAAALPACLHLLGRRESRAWGACASALALAALALSGSRSGWLGGLAGVSVYGWARGRLTRVAALGLAAACLVAVGALSVRRGPSDLQRVEIWRSAARIWAARPVLGAGPQSFDREFRRVRSEAYAISTGGMATQEDAHDDWLQVLAGLGLAGLAAYAWLNWAVWKVLRKAFAEDASGDEAALGGGLVALFIAAKLNAMTWIVVFAAAVLAGALAAAAREDTAGISQPGVSPEKGRKARETIVAALTVGVSVAAAIVSILFMAADRSERLGVRARAEGRPRESALRLERAVALRPGESRYRLNLANLLWDAAQDGAAPDRLRLQARALDIAVGGAERRPLEPDMVHLAGLAEFRLVERAEKPLTPGQARVLALSRRDLERAAGLDPSFPPVLLDAARAARAAGDEAAAARFDERLSRLTQKR